MDTDSIQAALVGLPIPQLRYFPQVESTNTTAMLWAEEGAPDLALVVADTQIHGRGRAGRRWFTPPGAALAFSLVLRHYKYDDESNRLARLTALGSMAVCDALIGDFSLPAQIKWPNDVLVSGRKVAGVLAEAAWQGSQLYAVILGIGVNIADESVPSPGDLTYPADCVERATGRRLDRLDFLRSILSYLISWQEKIDSDEYLHHWQESLAFWGERVQLQGDGEIIEGRLVGLDSTGALRLLTK